MKKIYLFRYLLPMILVMIPISIFGQTQIEVPCNSKNAVDMNHQRNNPPTAVCVDYYADLDFNGIVTIIPENVDGGSSDPEGPITLSIDVDTYTCADIGVNIVTLTVTDTEGLTDSCMATVYVYDVTAPVLICENTDIELGPDGLIEIEPFDVLSTMEEACVLDEIYLDIFEFDCDDIGTPILVTVFASDQSGNSTSCQTYINIVDTMEPTLTCPGNYYGFVNNPSGYYTIPDYFALGTASFWDNCTEIEEIVIIQDPPPGTDIYLSNGICEVTCTAEDEYSNLAICTFDVTPVCCLGVEENSLSDRLDIFPIPTTNIVKIVNKSSVVLDSIMIYNLNGKLLQKANLQNTIIDVSNLTSGVYMVKIIGENVSAVKRLIIE